MTSFKPCKHDKHPLECPGCVATEETKKRFEERFIKDGDYEYPFFDKGSILVENLLSFIESECQRREREGYKLAQDECKLALEIFPTLTGQELLKIVTNKLEYGKLKLPPTNLNQTNV